VFGVVNVNVNVCRSPCCTSRAALARVRAATLRHVSSLRYAAVRHVMLHYGSEMTSFSVVPDHFRSLPVAITSFPVDIWTFPDDMTSLPVVPDHFRSTSGSLTLTSGSYDVISGRYLNVLRRYDVISGDSWPLPVDFRSLPVAMTSFPVFPDHFRSTYKRFRAIWRHFRFLKNEIWRETWMKILARKFKLNYFRFPFLSQNSV
jgi:hypothetical protein